MRWLSLLSCISIVGLMASPAHAQSRLNRPAPDYLQLSPPDQEEGRQVLEEFRSRGLAGDYYLSFELRVMPRRGAERLLHGDLWGTRGTGQPLSRVVIREEPSPEASSAEPGEEVARLLIEQGRGGRVWHATAGGEARELGADELLEPVAGTLLTPFELQMPFLHWREFIYEGLARHRGRPAHRFVMYPPADLAAAQPELAGVRVWIDAQFTALVQAELLGEGAQPRKTITVVDLKRLDDQWIVKTIDLRDEATRDKTRFSVTGAALDCHFAPALFTPGLLGAQVTAPAETQRFD